MKKTAALILSVIFVFLTAFPVFSVNEEAKESEETTVAETKKPKKVQNLEAYKTTDSSITMHWKKVSDADAYAVYMFSEKDNKYNMIALEEETKYQATKLSAGKTYKFYVKSAKYEEKKIVYSEKSEVLEAVTAPKKVGGIFTSDIEKDSISLSWTKASGATAYEAWIYDKNQDKFSLYEITEKASVTFGGLSENTLYSFKIRAIRSKDDAIAYGKFSDVFTEFTDSSSKTRTKAQAAKLYNSSISLLKKEKDIKVTYKKTVETETKSCSKYSLTRTVRNMMNLFVGKLEKVYQFKNAKSEDKTVSSLIQPTGKNSALRAKDITKFSLSKEDGTSVLKIVLKSDNATFDGKTKTETAPAHNSRVLVAPKVKNQKTSPVKIKKANELFEGSTLTMKIGEKGKVKSLKIVCPVEITADCKVSTIDFSTVVGYVMTESFSVKYLEEQQKTSKIAQKTIVLVVHFQLAN